jgi:hypothetical protein
MPLNFDQYIAGRRTNPPARLYKYRSVEQALRILKEGALWWSPPRDFTKDRDDCQCNPYAPLLTVEAQHAEDEETRRRLAGGRMDMDALLPDYRPIWEGMRRLIQDLPPDQRAAKIDAMMNQKNYYEMRQARFASRLDSLVTRLRVLCLCAEANSGPMWEEYADKQKGCLLAFDTWTLERTWRVPVERVVYGLSPPVLVSVDRTQRRLMGEAVDLDGEMEELGLRWPLHKGMKFAHEREWRFVGLERDKANPTRNEAVPFVPEALLEVVYGTACSLESRRALKRAIRDLRTRPRPNVIPSLGKTQ